LAPASSHPQTRPARCTTLCRMDVDINLRLRQTQTTRSPRWTSSPGLIRRPRKSKGKFLAAHLPFRMGKQGLHSGVTCSKLPYVGCLLPVRKRFRPRRSRKENHAKFTPCAGDLAREDTRPAIIEKIRLCSLSIGMEFGARGAAHFIHSGMAGLTRASCWASKHELGRSHGRPMSREAGSTPRLRHHHVGIPGRRRHGRAASGDPTF